MGIAGGLWRVKPEQFCLFLGAHTPTALDAERPLPVLIRKAA